MALEFEFHFYAERQAQKAAQMAFVLVLEGKLALALVPSASTKKDVSYIIAGLSCATPELIEKSMDCKLRRNPDTGAHGCESGIDPK